MKTIVNLKLRLLFHIKLRVMNFLYIFAAKENSKEYFKEKIEYLIRKENKYPEILKNGLNLSDLMDKIIYKNRKRTFLQTIKDNEVNLFKIADLWLDSDESDVKEIQLLQLKTNTVDESRYKETKRLEKESPDTFKPFWLEADSIWDIYKIGSYKIVTRKKMIQVFLEKSHTSIKSHLKPRAMADYLSNTLNVFWPNMYDEWVEFCKAWESCQMFQTFKKRSRIIKYIKSSSWYERYQADTVELDSRITEDNKYSYLFTIVDHFSKYGFAYPIKDKKAETIRDHIAQAFIIGDPSMLHTDNGKEFVNNTLSSWLENRGIRQVLGGKYHPQSQGAVESFNKTIQRFLNEAFANSIFNWEEINDHFH